MLNLSDKQATAMSVKMIATISSYADGHIRGELSCHYFNKPFVFTCLMHLIEVMETTFDTAGFPEKQLSPRTFHEAKHREKRHDVSLHEHLKKKQTDYGESAEGETISSFEITVQFRHNAEWQGMIHWLEKGTTKNFSSIVEMVNLLDAALCE